MPRPIRITKTKSEVPLLQVNFARSDDPWLSSGELINSAYVWEGSSGLAIASISNISSGVLFYVSSGIVDAIYTVDVAVVTNFGRQAVRSFEMSIVATKYVE